VGYFTLLNLFEYISVTLFSIFSEAALRLLNEISILLSASVKVIGRSVPKINKGQPVYITQLASV
jgi:hypothetical protein